VTTPSANRYDSPMPPALPPDLIFPPMGALAALTFVVLLLIPSARFMAAFAGKVNREDFRYGESANVPGSASLPNRNYMNLLELPLLFYVVCLMYFVSNRVDQNILLLAWSYVAARTLHSLIHLTYNHVFHRLIVFGASNVILIFMWIRFF
jgi:hypothetical protein